jgi:hypothetical protein
VHAPCAVVGCCMLCSKVAAPNTSFRMRCCYAAFDVFCNLLAVSGTTAMAAGKEVHTGARQEAHRSPADQQPRAKRALQQPVPVLAGSAQPAAKKVAHSQPVSDHGDAPSQRLKQAEADAEAKENPSLLLTRHGGAWGCGESACAA